MQLMVICREMSSLVLRTIKMNLLSMLRRSLLLSSQGEGEGELSLLTLSCKRF